MAHIPSCTEGTDVFIHLEAHNGAVVIDDISLSIPGTRYYLLKPVALKEVKDRMPQGSGAILIRDWSDVVSYTCTLSGPEARGQRQTPAGA